MNHASPSNPASHAAHAASNKPPVAVDPNALSTMLKVQTSAQHTLAERHPVQGLLISGRITRPQLAAYLSQLHVVHEALDAGLEQLAQSNVKVRSALKAYHPHAGRVRSDLRHLAGTDLAAPLRSTARFVEGVRSLADARDVGLVGVWYVLEGSTNGGQYIAKALMHALALTPEQVQALDPHGPLQRERWQQWRTDIDSADFDPGQRERAIEQAGLTFVFMSDMMDELVRSPAFSGEVSLNAAVVSGS